MPQSIVRVEDLKKVFPLTTSLFRRTHRLIRAVDGVSFDVQSKEAFGLVGETGCGKTTVGRILAGLIKPTDGKVFYKNRAVWEIDAKEFKQYRKEIGMIFQDPFGSLNPRKDILKMIEGTINSVYAAVSDEERTNMVLDILDKVSLSPPEQFIHKYPHELSGGQRQRVSIARALVGRPSFMVADEPVASLDASIKSQILNLLKDIQQEFSMSFLLISHDLLVVRYMCNRFGVLYAGKLFELGSAEAVFNSPLHPYTKCLLSAILVPDPTAKREHLKVKGEPPRSSTVPGCAFNPRCLYKKSICSKKDPPLREVDKRHYVACHLYS